MKHELLAIVLALSACDDSLHRGWLIDRTRVLGARVEVLEDPPRATVGPEEMARVDWWLATPHGIPSVGYRFALCLPPDGNVAQPRCEMGVFSEGSGTAVGELVSTNFVAPPASELGDGQELLMLAAFCESTEPEELEPTSFTARCSAGEPWLASLRIRLQSSGSNSNPPAPILRLGSIVLTENTTTPPGEPCTAGSDLPVFDERWGQTELVYVFDGSERESGEALLLSTFVTEGELDRQHSAFDPEEAAPKEVRLAWSPPILQEGESRSVRFYAVLRDGRGGASLGRFAVCVRRD